MTDKLHCPFCGMELKTDVNLLGYSTKYWYCENTSCAHLKDSMREDVWQALIDGKKAQDALKVAIKGIKEIESDNERGLGEGGGLYSDDTPFEELLKEITSITTQEKE